jgi:hypothetical protein
MPGPILHVGAVIRCPHAGRALPVTANTRVLVSGMPALVVSDAFPVTGCSLHLASSSGTKPQPCTMIQWTVPSARVRVNGQPVLCTTSTGICLSFGGVVQGQAIPNAVQPRVIG